MTLEILEKLEPILKSDWRILLPENSNFFDLIENESLAKFDSKQIKNLLCKSEVSRVFAEAILNIHYSKRKLFYKRNKREQETLEEQRLGATIGILQELRNFYENEKNVLRSEIGFYQSALDSQ
ncbi:hypothetical protein LOD99_3849 [Oopsacas minuta]|uniref:Uncharacterized protein n=1 Tax=Oopsacas minuta TaxID=111878 RepID=A0AAV7JX11_9METZ|nr:hypothetical protein LOD99_3849 [Oopsacas minuta]